MRLDDADMVDDDEMNQTFALLLCALDSSLLRSFSLSIRMESTSRQARLLLSSLTTSIYLMLQLLSRGRSSNPICTTNASVDTCITIHSDEYILGRPCGRLELAVYECQLLLLGIPCDRAPAAGRRPVLTARWPSRSYLSSAAGQVWPSRRRHLGREPRGAQAFRALSSSPGNDPFCSSPGEV